MRVTTADLWEPTPGTLLRWDISATGPGRPAELSLNQLNHLACALGGEDSVWLTATFDVDGPIEPVALSRTWRAFVERHSSLRLEAVDTADGPQARVHHPGTLRWSVAEVGHTPSVDATRTALAAALSERCQPFGYPAFLPAAISRPSRSTIVLGMDHLHCDAYSLTVAVDELSRLYESFRGSRTPTDGVDLPETACFVSAVADSDDGPTRVAPDDDRLHGWQEFARRRGYEMPTFPLPLGLEPGERVAQATLVRDLVDAETMTQVSTRARSAGASTYAAVLAATASAVAGIGGPDRLDTMAPVSTRTDEASMRAIGWYTTTVPLTVAADVSDLGLAEAGEAVRHGVRLAGVPLDQVMESLPEPIVRTRGDVFMVSWVDYRHLPGGADHLDLDAHHISAPTLADDVQIWFARTPAGLSMRVRYPDTSVAGVVIEAFTDALTLRLRRLGEPAEARV
ncbi:MAG: hypothetical protein J2O46_09495 [Nocardioides sp.]|nr:hypothetical protein [Nocardioides sp.]